jgi:hypothetical protein
LDLWQHRGVQESATPDAEPSQTMLGTQRILKDGSWRRSRPALWIKGTRDQLGLLAPKRRAVAPLFDESFYRDSYPDVTTAGLNPLSHFLDRGWREGRDPSADFSTSDYLIDHPDVVSEGINPLLHYTRQGKREGRLVRPSRLIPEDLPRHEKLLIRLFDDTFYRASNPDIEDADITGLEHYRTWGWKEGRDPAPWFDVRFYLASNPDVMAAAEEPFAHYLAAGKFEGRLARDPILFDRAGFMKMRSAHAADHKRQLLRRVDGRAQSRPRAPHRLGAFPDLPAGRLVVSVGSTDYTNTIGGVETCVANEQLRLTEQGCHYLYVAPREASLPLRPDGDYDLALHLDGDLLGCLPAGQLKAGLAALPSRVTVDRVAIHGLLGHHPGTIAAAVAGLPVDYWIHDYFALCTNPALTRSGLDFCGAPPPSSGACRVCSFGQGRAHHFDEMTDFLQVSGARAVAPSHFAAEQWSSMMGWPLDSVRVVPHGRVIFSDIDLHPRTPGRRPRLAFIGGPVHAKGWSVFTELARWAISRNDIDLFHFGHHSPERPGVRHIATMQNDGSNLTRKIAEWDIDAVLVWPTWPETFSLVVYEVIAGGAKVLTHPGSGNVLPAATGYDRAIVLADDRALRRAAITGRLAALLSEECGSPRARGEFVFEGLTPAMLSLG